MAKILFNLDKWLKDRFTPVSRKSAIRLKCLDCTGNQSNEVKQCKAYNCPLWSYRLGRAWEKPQE